MKPKIVKLEDGTEAIAMKNGQPVFIDDSGSEIAVDVVNTFDTIKNLRAEAKNHRLAKEEAETKLSQFDGIEDPAAARKALQTIRNLDDKKLVDAGEVEKVKSEAIKAVEAQFKPVMEERDSLKATLNREMIGGSFARSKFIQDKIAIPADLVEARFGSNFGIENGKVVAKDTNGNPIYSKARPGELADFDEALETLVNQYPQRDNILKGSGASGSGASGSGSGGGSGPGKMTRAEFDALPAMQKSALMSKGEVQIVDAA